MKLNARLRNTAGAAAITLSILFSSAVLTTTSTYAAEPFKGSWTVAIANTDGDTIRMRNGAGSSYDQVGEAHEGEVASILDGPGVDSKGNTWYKIKLSTGSGWVRSDFLSTKVPSEAQAASTSTQEKSGTAATAKAAPAVQKAPAASPKLTGSAHVANTDGDSLRIRKEPSQSGTVITTIDAGASVVIKQGPTVDSSKIAWYQVSADGVTGWAMAQYLAQSSTSMAEAKTAAAPKPVAPAPAAAAPKPAVQAQPAVQKDTKPAAPAAPKAAAPAPAKAAPAVASTAKAAAQPAAAARSGQSRAAVQPASSSARGQSIVGVAMRYVGYRYRFGGTTPAGFDCSGFVYYVVNHSGGSISRDMYAQFASGTRVSASNLQPGDLLFFSGTYKSGLSHAGIYIGNGRFVHAENESTGVTVSDLWSAYWASHYTGAVRVR